MKLAQRDSPDISNHIIPLFLNAQNFHWKKHSFSLFQTNILYFE